MLVGIVGFCLRHWRYVINAPALAALDDPPSVISSKSLSRAGLTWTVFFLSPSSSPPGAGGVGANDAAAMVWARSSSSSSGKCFMRVHACQKRTRVL